MCHWFIRSLLGTDFRISHLYPQPLVKHKSDYYTQIDMSISIPAHRKYTSLHLDFQVRHDDQSCNPRFQSPLMAKSAACIVASHQL